MWRYPGLEGVGPGDVLCGPESFTPDVHPLLGPAPEVEGVYVAAGMNSLGILTGGGAGSIVAQWIVDGRAPGRRHALLGRACAAVRDDPSVPRRAGRRVAGRAVRGRGVAVVPVDERPRSTALGPARQARRGRCAIRPVGWVGVPALLRRSGRRVGAARGDVGPNRRVPPAAGEHRADREAVGVMDMSLMSKFLVQGPDAGTVLNRLSVSEVDGGIGRVVYTQWCDVDGGLLADLTITKLGEQRFLVVSSDDLIAGSRRCWRREPDPDLKRSPPMRRHRGTTFSCQCRGRVSRDSARTYVAPRRLVGRGIPVPRCALRSRVGSAPWSLALRVTYVGELGYELLHPC